MKIVPLFGAGVGYRSRTVSAQRRRNLYLEMQCDPDQSSLVMYGTPGRALWSAFGSAPTRGTRSVTITNYAYVVAGPQLFQIDNSGGATVLGTLNTSSGRVSLSDNGLQLIIVDGTEGYIYTFATGVFAAIADANFPDNATSVTFLNGYFIVNKPGTGQFWWSALYDGTTWNGLQFATAESNPDDLVAVYSNQGVLYLFGQVTIEFWSASGDTAVWRRIGGSGIEW